MTNDERAYRLFKSLKQHGYDVGALLARPNHEVSEIIAGMPACSECGAPK